MPPRIGNKFSKKQKQTISLLAAGGKNFNQISEELNISRATLHRWQKNPQFMEAVIEEARTTLKSFLPNIYTKLTSSALAGDFQFVKLMIEHIEKLEEMKNKQSLSSITFTWDPNSKIEEPTDE